MLVCVDSLSFVVSERLDNESIIRMDVSVRMLGGGGIISTLPHTSPCHWNDGRSLYHICLHVVIHVASCYGDLEVLVAG